MKRINALAAAIVFTGVLVAPAMAGAAPNGPGASGWHLGYYNPSNRALSMAQAAPGGGLASINFTNQNNTALLLNTQGNSPLLGNDLGKTVTATFTISGAAASDFTYYGEDPLVSLPAASVRIYFETSNAGGFSPANYWWSYVGYHYLSNGTFTITAAMTPSSANWDTWDGGASYSDSAFSTAASNVTGIGLSFGGGDFFENGVGTMDGSGTFTLTSFSVS